MLGDVAKPRARNGGIRGMAQHPRFETFKSAWRMQDYARALVEIDAVIAAHPQVAALHWYRANCLEKLDRHFEALLAVDAVLARAPDHAAALVKQVALDWSRDAAEDDDGDDDDEEPTAAQLAERERRDDERRQRYRAQLQRAIALDPNLADAYFALWQLQCAAGDGTAAGQQAQADAWLTRAIALQPDRAEFVAARADAQRLRAMQVPDDTPDADCVTTFSGMRFQRDALEAALRDYRHCAGIDASHRYPLQAAKVLHDLGRFDEALAQYDVALQRLPADAPQRPYLLQARARSENGGAGERDKMAAMLESVIAAGDRNQHDDMAATALLGAARAVRQGKRVGEALAARLPESPDDLMAANIAEQILNVAYENAPDLIEVDAATFPAYQRHYAARQRNALQRSGFRHVADAEASGMTPVLGQRALLTLHVDASSETIVNTFALRPKWPGTVAFLLLLISGKWKTHRMTECMTYFDDGGYLITQYENVSPFGYGDAVDIERLPRSTRVAALVARHAQRVEAYRQRHPDARACPANDLDAIDANFRRGQAIKRAYRQSIGYVDDAELRRMLGGHYDRFATKIRAKIAELAPDREAATATP